MEKRLYFITMNIQQAKELIAFENPEAKSQLWIDLGCGSGLFTAALTNYLPAGSKIMAIDQNRKAIEQVPALVNGIVIETMVADFIHDVPNVTEADGILMANSLHYVKDKEGFLRRLHSSLKTNAVFLLVEYDRTRANPWVPYPLTIDAAKELFKKLSYENFKLLNKRPSAYGDDMYAAMIS